MRALLPLAVAIFAAPAALADTALLIANTRHDTGQSLRHADEIAALERPLTEAGFEVIVVENGTAEAMAAGCSSPLPGIWSGRSAGLGFWEPMPMGPIWPRSAGRGFRSMSF